jgi:hypothetical protein
MRKRLAVFHLARLVIVDFHDQLTLYSISGMPSVNSDFCLDAYFRLRARPGASVRAVLDTNIVVSGLLWRAAPRQVLDAARVVAKDIDDDAVIACALAGQADLIISGDAHLLNLKHYQGMRIIDAAEALRSLAQ